MVVRNLELGMGRTKICVPIVERTEHEVCKMAEKMLVPEIDLLEWRLDYLDDVFDVESVLNIGAKLRQVVKNKPILATFRTKEEGGEKKITWQCYTELLKALAQSGNVDLIDVEAWRASEEQEKELIIALQKNVSVIASYHNFSETPSDAEMVDRLCYMDRLGADIPKLAVMPRQKEDAYRLMMATQEAKKKIDQKPLITMSMAADGVISRLVGEHFGSAVTFGCLGKASAPGQVEVADLYKMTTQLHNIVSV